MKAHTTNKKTVQKDNQSVPKSSQNITQPIFVTLRTGKKNSQLVEGVISKPHRLELRSDLEDDGALILAIIPKKVSKKLEKEEANRIKQYIY